MEKKKLEQARYRTKFRIDQSTIQQINPEFSLCTVLVAYHGDNRNHSSISKEVFEKCLWTIYGIPIVGEWVRLEEDQNVETWGSHGGRLIWDDQGIKYEQTTKPFGFVTEEAYKNATWVELTEKDGHTTHEYLKLERCILWNSRYEECDSILESNFGQSMELTNLDGRYREDGFFEISDFTFSALCILGTAEPCFESAMIGRQYGHELNQFKKEFRLMMEEYRRFGLGSKNESPESRHTAEPETEGEDSQSNVPSNTEEGSTNEGNPDEQQQQNSTIEKEDAVLKISFADVCDKIKTIMAEYAFRHGKTGKQYDKYIVLSISEADKSITIIDRENSYAAFKLPYVATQTKDGLVVNIDYEKQVQMALGAIDAAEAAFDVRAEVDTLVKDITEYDINFSNNAKISELTEKLEQKTAEYEAAYAKNVELEKHLVVFENEKKQYMAQKHKDIIDTLVASRKEEMGKFSEFLDYCIAIDYNKTVEQVEKDIKEIHYNFMLKTQPGHARNFSAITVPVANDTSGGLELESNSIAERYGEDIAKYFHTN